MFIIFLLRPLDLQSSDCNVTAIFLEFPVWNLWALYHPVAHADMASDWGRHRDIKHKFVPRQFFPLPFHVPYLRPRNGLKIPV